MADLNERVRSDPEPGAIRLRVFSEAKAAKRLGEATFRPDELLTVRATDVILVDRWHDGAELIEGQRVVFRLHDAAAIRGVLVEVEGEVGVLVQEVLLQ